MDALDLKNSDTIYKLIGRTPRAQRDMMQLEYLKGATVLVTGAGGSIGSVLCKRLACSGAKRILMVDMNEFNLYSIDRQIRSLSCGVETIPLLADIRHEHVLRALFWKYKPHVVFHAAALKHVPLLQSEHNAIEAVRTNVLGTKLVVEQAGRCPDTEAVVLISTDKAVHPACAMGLTKRCAEKTVFNLSNKHPHMKHVVVRFGNVLGSSGSVVPLFLEQICGGGPVTITDPDMERYLMTIDEAVDLVFGAADEGIKQEDNFGLFVLDMGKPVKIPQLAQRLMTLVGMKVPIEFIGMRAGEKLHEELFYDHEKPQKTGIDGVRRVSTFLTTTLLERKLDRLIRAVDARNYPDAMGCLLEIVSEYSLQEAA